MKNILNKLHQIQKEVPVMAKDGHNDFNKYDYLSETQITVKMKNLLDKHGVVFSHNSEITGCHPYTSKNGGNQFLVSVKVSYKFYDVESGEFLEGYAYGQGADMGDKGVYKAITGAIKYIFMKNFMIPTGDDCEKDTPVKSFKETYKPIAGAQPQRVYQANNQDVF